MALNSRDSQAGRQGELSTSSKPLVMSTWCWWLAGVHAPILSPISAFRMDSNDCFIALLPTDLLLRVLSTPCIGARDLAACGATCRLFRQIPAGASGCDALILTEAAARAGCLRIFLEAHFQVTFTDFLLALPRSFALPRGRSQSVDAWTTVIQVDTQQRIWERCHHSWTVLLHYLQVS